MTVKKILSHLIIGVGLIVTIIGTSVYAQGGKVLDPASPSVKKVQTLITQLKGESPTVQEISVLAKTADGKVAAVASTNSDVTGKPSSEKDAEVVEGGSLSIRNENGVFDIKVPLKTGAGQAYGAAGIKLANQDGLLTIPKAKQQASDIAKKIEQALAL